MFLIQQKILINQPTNFITNNIAASSGDYSASTDSVPIDTTNYDGQHVECPTCIDPPDDDTSGPPACYPSDEYTLSATLNNTTVSTTTNDVPTWRLAPFWGGIIQEVESELENFQQDATSLLQPSPHHQFFEIDYRLTAETIVMPSGDLNLSLKLFDLFSRLYFQRTSHWSTNAILTVSADAFEVEGIYNVAQDDFVITDSEFENLDADVDIGGIAPIVNDILCFFEIDLICPVDDPDGIVEETVRDLIVDEIDQVNRNSPNMFLRSLINHPEIDNILPLLDQAIMELLQDDVSAILNVALPSCGDIDRDGLIDLEVSTN